MAKEVGPQPWTDAICAAVILLLGVLLYVVGAGLLEQWQQSSLHRQGPDVEDLLSAAAAISGALLVGWWVVSLLLATATTALDRMGNLRAAAVTRRLSPAFMRRLVLAALSVQLVAGPAAHADTTVPGPQWAPTQDQVSSAPADPGNAAGSSAFTTPGDGADRVMAHPPIEEVVKDNTPPPSRLEPGWQPAAPTMSPGLLTAPGVRSIGDAGTEARAVTVLAGDTLWDIAAFALGPEATDVDVALAWPRWYEANRSVIGQNPDVLLPGQILQPPSAA
ncbi:putative uncharacterized protein [Pseudarthrobacter siccitolerans]|uniref:LysM domain protein n=1 Tax=Pseudarthrobacter siccitolerans TaxID=861266 RepID=A0A024H0M6_9MICC|nr:hypothetical protein [Pseudarthrobacter siccitolerans]CCQ45543.1 putative uncharacterized protein [Pseudarthrobacter siccitolerans]